MNKSFVVKIVTSELHPGTPDAEEMVRALEAKFRAIVSEINVTNVGASLRVVDIAEK